MHSHLAWYVARSTGLVGWALLTASVLWGLAISTKATVGGRRLRPAWMLDMHRTLGGLAVVFTGVHVLALAADSTVHFDLVSILVPFASTWHPAAVAWGVVGLYLLLAVELTSLARVHLPRRVWRRVHVASFPLFAVATIHGVTAGTDGRSTLFVLAATGAVLAVGTLAFRRARDAAQPPVTTTRRIPPNAGRAPELAA
jgi:hypothetical protein